MSDVSLGGPITYCAAAAATAAGSTVACIRCMDVKHESAPGGFRVGADMEDERIKQTPAASL